MLTQEKPDMSFGPQKKRQELLAFHVSKRRVGVVSTGRLVDWSALLLN